jgi:hypothetical protein
MNATANVEKYPIDTVSSGLVKIAEGRSTPKIDRVYLSQSRELSQSIKMYLLE